jgi:hypothetical protein
MVRWLRDATPPLGSILLIDCLDARPNARDARAVMEIAPWCPVAFLTTPDNGRPGMRRSARLTVVYGLDGGDGGTARILDAVSARPRPSPSDMVQWVSQRTKLPLVQRTLSDLFYRAVFRPIEPTYLAQVQWEHLEELGNWGEEEWKGVARLAELAADRVRLNRVRAARGRPWEEICALVDRLLGVTCEEFAERVGWEWVLEQGLHRAGFFNQSAQPRPVRRQRARATFVAHGAA